MTHVEIKDVASVGPLVQRMAKYCDLSMTALVGPTGSLLGLATGSRVPGDLSLSTLLRVVQRARWEFVIKPSRDQDIILARSGCRPLLLRSLDGGPIEIQIREMVDFPTALLTVAMANDMSITGLVRGSGASSGTLVAFATGGDPDRNLRLTSLLRVVQHGKFTLYARPQFSNLRKARLHAEASRLLSQ